MSIPQKIGTTVQIYIKDGACTSYTDIQLTFVQKSVKFIFEPTVIDDENLTITFTDYQAKQLDTSPATWQIIAKDEDGNNIYTPTYTVGIDYIIEGWKNA